MKRKNKDWIWPRSDTHVVLGIPGSMECYKTWIEPGNSFSPGIASFGVSLWIKNNTTGELCIPETMPLEKFNWHFRDGHFPIVISQWNFGKFGIESRLFKHEKNHWYTDFLRLRFSSETPGDLTVYLVIRSFGPCGGRIESVYEQGDGKTIIINDYPLIQGNQNYDQFAAVDCGNKDLDIGSFIITGSLPQSKSAKDKQGWCSLSAVYTVQLEGKEKELSWQFPVYMPVSRASSLIPFKPLPPLNALEMEEQIVSRWNQTMTRMEIQVPDKRFYDMFHAQMLHMLMMITGDDVRIETSFYPLFWLRDGVYIINALEKGGYDDLAEKALKRIINGDFYGGFGSEADAPSEGIWALAEHYFYRRDRQWLAQVYPAIHRKADWIERMMTADETIYDYSTEMVASFIRASMANGLVCHPIKDGIIQGNMDHHIPYYWINCWAVYGLRLSVICAEELGFKEDAAKYAKLAKKLHKNLMEYFPKNFRETPVSQGIYSFGVALWPTHTFDTETVREEFDTWWNTWRCPKGKYNAAFDWTYFEAAQAHNYLFLGEVERFHIILNRYYQHQDVPGLYGYNEGKNAINADGSPVYAGQDWGFGNILDYRGWDNFVCNMPHNWVSSELYLMMRDALLFEEDETLVIGAGIPKDWTEIGKTVGVKNAPTHFGRVSYDITFNATGLNMYFNSERIVSKLHVWIPSVEVDQWFISWNSDITIPFKRRRPN
jgi:hypothetical protein